MHACSICDHFDPKQLPVALGSSELYPCSSRPTCFWCTQILVQPNVICNGQLHFHGQLKGLAKEKNFRALVRSTYRQDWVVYAKRPFGGAEHVLKYLGGYTHRVALSNHRLVSLDRGQVTFRWRDSASHNKQPC